MRGVTADTRPLIVLGSSSPRRRELLSHICEFQVVKPEVEETPKPGEAPETYAARNALEKGEWVLGRVADRAPHGVIVISADTIVVVDGRILEKPSDAAHARQMLKSLSARTHRVISGVMVSGRVSSDREDQGAEKKSVTRQFLVESRVTFKPLSDAEISHYISSGEPFDKAGGYAAQGIGSYMIMSIDGSYSNVVGLPMAELVTVLEGDFGCRFWDAPRKEKK